MQNETISQDLLVEMMDWCFINDIEYITELMDYAAEFRDDWNTLLANPDVERIMSRYLSAHSER